MAQYRYRARDQRGTLYQGVLEASSPETVARRLEELGFVPIQVEPVRLHLSWKGLWEALHPIQIQDWVVLIRQMATLLGAGLPFTTTMDILVEQTQHPRLRRVLSQVRRDVEGGMSLSEALRQHRGVFTPLTLQMIQAGETAGVLDRVLSRLAWLMERDAETRARIKSALRYPLLVLLAMGGAFWILVTWVVPRFAQVYQGLRAELPWPTRVLIGLNHFFQDYGWLLLALGLLVGLGIRHLLQTSQGAALWDRWKLRLPIVGPIFEKSALSRFARTFGTLIQSGLPMMQTLEMVATTVGNRHLEAHIREVLQQVRKGEGLAAPLRQSRAFPPLVCHMVAVGEETGRLDEMLIRVSEYYDLEVDQALRTLTASLEPLLLVVIGGMVLFLALGIFLPWWDLIRAFHP